MLFMDTDNLKRGKGKWICLYARKNEGVPKSNEVLETVQFQNQK